MLEIVLILIGGGVGGPWLCFKDARHLLEAPPWIPCSGGASVGSAPRRTRSSPGAACPRAYRQTQPAEEQVDKTPTQKAKWTAERQGEAMAEQNASRGGGSFVADLQQVFTCQLLSTECVRVAA